ncbi:hypothetical protein QC763_306710 [Podospora pseudopauciseta]|uniref:Amine oxidase domain-containing protein n=1 Tax=Podospora pseudopauciseta TaxID=2093780 RepID=A0ABR0HGH1_9PEZI|nr:hypothetical protein QC763_306710 [Podospora pseudopauciseta]
MTDAPRQSSSSSSTFFRRPSFVQPFQALYFLMIQRGNPHPRKKVAVVGSGVAGIGALWALNRSPHDVYIFEAADRLGGHANTVEFTRGKYKTLVDAGFMVMNEATYPNFLNFLRRMKVETAPAEMSFSVSRDQGRFEWASLNRDAFFCQRSNYFSPRMWRLVFDIWRFDKFALDVLRAEKPTEETIGEYLEREGYSTKFKDDYLTPITASFWNTSPEKCALDFPVATLIRFMWNHHFLASTSKNPQWLTLNSGSKSYIDAVMKGFPSNHVRLNSKVISITPERDGRLRLHTLHPTGGKSEVFDHVILATHGDQALSIIGDSATEAEDSILRSFQTSTNEVFLHSDLSLMPERYEAWTSFNYLSRSSPMTGSGHIDQVCLTYNMNILQEIPRAAFGDVLVTLNPLHKPDPKTIQGRYTYRHTIFNKSVLAAQERLPEIQNTRGISYAGAWTRQGTHEDGFSSGLRVAVEHLGANIPFEFEESTLARGERPRYSLWDYVIRFLIWLVQVLFLAVIDKIAGGLTTTRRRLVSRVGAKGTALNGRVKVHEKDL